MKLKKGQHPPHSPYSLSEREREMRMRKKGLSSFPPFSRIFFCSCCYKFRFFLKFKIQIEIKKSERERGRERERETKRERERDGQ